MLWRDKSLRGGLGMLLLEVKPAPTAPCHCSMRGTIRIRGSRQVSAVMLSQDVRLTAVVAVDSSAALTRSPRRGGHVPLQPTSSLKNGRGKNSPNLSSILNHLTPFKLRPASSPTIILPRTKSGVSTFTKDIGNTSVILDKKIGESGLNDPIF
ncbi:hypothetical protein B0T17DRAFT_233923 [Bombardia bombarda]|uniref:Uncharacterized protein n=1 Tax=Bombardia bombarda TaxID=252184 RepID=A0AA39XBH8_9PEZI|nr:hypothetical protein B0T17DRAFT_233923 [Bombardia bombarda]